MSCPTTVHETVCIEAEVTITPQVEVGTIQTFCVGNPIIGFCPGVPVSECSFPVSQNICVQVPLTFFANGTAEPIGIVCGEPATGGCPDTTACTYAVGSFRTNPVLVSSLIAGAGGSIILGSDSLGLSYTVTAANAQAVLEFNTPSPPTPASLPFSAQYEVLYAQLLAAKLNVLNGATCETASTAIADSDAFLASSPAGGQAGAPALTAVLTDFNEGVLGGCPGHCSEL